MSEGIVTKTGFKGLDSILLGGIPRTNVILVQRMTGSGKTLMGLEFIYRGIIQFNEPGLIVVFRDNPDKLIETLPASDGTNLTSTDHIARLVGCESKVVGRALDRLERKKLIERSRASRGVRLYRVLASKDAERRGCLRELVTLSESRNGRLGLAKRLIPIRSESARQEPESMK